MILFIFGINLYYSITINLGNFIISLDGITSGIVDLRTTLQCVQGNNPRSFSFMIQTTSTSCSYILSTGSVFVTSYSGFSIMFSCNSGSNNIIQIDAYIAGYYPSVGKIINDGLWHTVLVTYDGTTILIYIDGILDNTITNWNDGSTATISSTLNTVGNSGNYLGQWADGDYGRWIGQLKNVMFFDYVIADPANIPLSLSLDPTISPTTGKIHLSYIMYIYIYE